MLLEEISSIGLNKNATVKRLSRQGVFATQFIENDTSDSKKIFSSKTPVGRSRGSVEIKSNDSELQKVTTKLHTNNVV